MKSATIPATGRFASLRVVTAIATVMAAAACGSPVATPEGVAVQRGGDLVATGRQVVVRDSVPGDVLAAGADVRFTGHAGGDLVAAAGNQVLRGVIEGSVRAAAGNLELHADVGRNITAVGGNIELEPSGRVRGNAYMAGGTIRILGTVRQLLRVAAREVVLDGTVVGDVHVETGELHVGPAARIGGDLRYRLGEDGRVEIDPGAVIEGEVIALEPRRRPWVFAALRWLWIAAFLFAGGIAVAVMPRATRTAAGTFRHRPIASFGAGLLWFVLAPLILVALAVTVIGLPIAAIGLAVYASLLYLAPVVVALWVGALLLRRAGPGRGALVRTFLLGGLILALLWLIPYAGLAVRLLATVLGLGALVVMVWDGSYRTAAEI